MTTADFFGLFDVPFQYGSGWTDAADQGPEPVVVLSRESNDKAFGGENSVGRTVRLGDQEFRVVGVLDSWSPSPKFYDLNNGSFDDAEDAYIPFRWGEVIELQVAGNTNCWKSEAIESAQDFLQLGVRVDPDVGRARRTRRIATATRPSSTTTRARRRHPVACRVRSTTGCSTSTSGSISTTSSSATTAC